MTKEIQSGIYKITQVDTGRIYIGSTINIAQRFYGHKICLRTGTHKNKGMCKDSLVYGADSFVFEILELTESDDNTLSEREKHWQDKFGLDNSYNGKGSCNRSGYYVKEKRKPIPIYLDDDERDALEKIAAQDHFSLTLALRQLIKSEAERRGLWLVRGDKNVQMG